MSDYLNSTLGTRPLDFNFAVNKEVELKFQPKELPGGELPECKKRSQFVNN